MAEEQEIASDESVAAEGNGGEAGCPIRMGFISGPRCGRKLHVARDGVDEKPVCLMHSKDPRKQSGPLFNAFWRKFERILEDAGEGEAHFHYFVFPETDFRKRKFQAICRFTGAIFTQNAYFSEATFTQHADFREATFTQNAQFREMTFTQDAYFYNTVFIHANFFRATFAHAIFFRAIFTQDADFSGAIFTQDADFSAATFTQDADFSESTFMGDTNLCNVTFKGEVEFQNAKFAKKAIFLGATFAGSTYFSDMTFGQAADFTGANFMHGAVFAGSTLIGPVIYSHAAFLDTGDWSETEFRDRADFRDTSFTPRDKESPSAVFSLARFYKPGEIVFDDVDLDRAVFFNCDVSQVWFKPSVNWGRSPRRGQLAVFEETAGNEVAEDYFFQVEGKRDYRAIAQIYRQLKKNYDTHLDYWTANEFHFGEMEMKRLAVPTSGRFLWLRQWWHRNLSFVAWYRLASDYGNSYRKPMAWLLGTLLAATFLFPIPGLELKQPISGNTASAASVTYIRVWNRQDSWTNNLWTEAKLIGKSGITAIDTATFQRTPEYTPVYPRGRVLAIFETLLTSSLFALFLLALRRQFRR
jgi:uncharacterized protein YjbI with pentapeptide repeats